MRGSARRGGGEARQSRTDARALRKAAERALDSVGDLRRTLVAVVRSATPGVDRRAGPRQPVSLAMPPELPGGQVPIDLPAGGAALRGPLRGLGAGMKVTPRLDRAPIRAEVLGLDEGGRVRLRFAVLDAAARAALDRQPGPTESRAAA